jgi:ATP phosphoribosyltransferase regulatory subunit HisZ
LQRRARKLQNGFELIGAGRAASDLT